jgi:hypothetical protein
MPRAELRNRGCGPETWIPGDDGGGGPMDFGVVWEAACSWEGGREIWFDRVRAISRGVQDREGRPFDGKPPATFGEMWTRGQGGLTSPNENGGTGVRVV